MTVALPARYLSLGLVAAERIQIGHRVQVGANSTIVDTDFHPLTPEGRAQDFLAGAHASIVIEDDVFICMQSLIRKGLGLSLSKQNWPGQRRRRRQCGHTRCAGRRGGGRQSGGGGQTA